jgi:hypothetical protein
VNANRAALWTVRAIIFGAVLLAFCIEADWDLWNSGIIGAVLISAFVTACLIAGTERICAWFNVPFGNFLTQLPWYAMQLAIMGACLWLAHRISERTGETPKVHVALIVGVAGAAVATGVVAKLLDLFTIMRTTLSGRVRNERDASSDHLRLARPSRPAGDSPQKIG